MGTLAEKIREVSKTPYQILADKYRTSYVYVVQIATGARKGTRGKGLLIKQELKKIATQNQ